jgi:hypothetical protein
MALSPNYSWSEPDNSSLVKNGAADIRTLGDAIDTSVWNVGYGQAGKNKIINGDFNINQRAFTTATSDGTYTFDRWVFSNTGVSCTVTPQTFTAGTAPVTGYESTNFARILTTGQTATTERSIYVQRIENVRTFAAQTVTVSFWAKAATGTPKIAIELSQNFGSGGSASVNNYGGQVTLSTLWVRYSATIAIPTISGKTIGTSSFLATNLWVSAGSDFNSRTGSLGIQSNTFDIWGVQAEYGSKATPFQTATGTTQELAACQRYFIAYNTSASAAFEMPLGMQATTTTSNHQIQMPVTMRTVPSVSQSAIGNWTVNNNINQPTLTSSVIFSGRSSVEAITIQNTWSGAIGAVAALVEMIANTTAARYFLSSEL